VSQLEPGRAPTTTRRSPSSWHPSERAVLLVPLALGLAMLLWRGPQLVDDAFITMRYSFHLAHGDGPVFNPGERVEGFSNPLWMLLLAAGSLVGLPLPQLALVVGALAFLGVVVLTTRLATLEDAGPVGALIAGTVVALSGGLVGSSLNGLETSLFTLGLTATTLLAAQDPLPRGRFVAALLVVAYSRPEGLPLALVIVAVTYLSRRRWSLDTRSLVPVALGAVVVTIGTLLARWAYYGELLPMSVIAKRDLDTGPLHSLARSAPDGIRYLFEALGPGWLLLALVTGGYLVARWRPPSGPVRVALTLTVVLGSIGTLVAVSNGGDWMPDGRLLVPYVPLVVAAMAAGLDTSTLPRGVLPAWAVLLVALQPHSWTNTWQPVHHEYDSVSTSLQEASGPDDTVTTNVLGHLGYASPSLRLFDVHGLTEPSIATQHLDADVYGKFDARLVAERADPVIVMNSWRLLAQVVAETDTPYVGITSPTLEASNVFVALRADAADRFTASLSSSYELEVVAFDQAVAAWRRAAPYGQSAGGGP